MIGSLGVSADESTVPTACALTTRRILMMLLRIKIGTATSARGSVYARAVLGKRSRLNSKPF